MKSHLSTISVETRRKAVADYLDDLIKNNIIPAKGTDLVAKAVLHINGRPLGVQILKFVAEEDQQYVEIEKITNSGGEGVVMAMFLYVLVSQLRSETHAKVHKNGGGPLILDNPFAKATKGDMWRAQRLLAKTMGVQLILATAIQDYNALGEFESFIRLRKAGKNTTTNRVHLEFVNYKLSASENSTFRVPA